MPTYVQSTNNLLMISADAGVTWKQLVCLNGHTFNGETPVTEEDTQCGTLSGLGSNRWSYEAEGVVDTAPVGASQVSYEDILGYWNTQTLLLIRDQEPETVSPGTSWYHNGSVYITSISKPAQVGSYVKFTVTFTGSGALDTTV
jgi:hypothetical protein